MPNSAVIAPRVDVNGSDVDSSYMPTEEELRGTAIVTMAAGDEAGRMALALMQSLRDVQTRVPHLVVMLMQGGVGSADCVKGSNPSGCSSSLDPGDIISRQYVRAFARLGVTLLPVEKLPDSSFTEMIAGGKQSGWGMAYNKLQVFGLKQYRKLLWMDSDTLVLRNIDHLLSRPEFTAAFTNDCNNANAAYKISGGMWVIEPSDKRMQHVLEITSSGKIEESQEWRLGDMEIVLFMFAEFTRASREDGYWPSSYDLRQGRTPGVELIDRRFIPGGTRADEHAGPIPDKIAEAKAAGKSPWYPLDVRYDYLVDECRAIEDRWMGLPRDSAAELGLAAADDGRPWGSREDDLAAPELPVIVERSRSAWAPVRTQTGYTDGTISLHYSCMQPPLNKPSWFSSEEEFVGALKQVPPCIRQTMMLWYSKFLRATSGERWFKGDGGSALSPPAQAKISLVSA